MALTQDQLEGLRAQLEARAKTLHDEIASGRDDVAAAPTQDTVEDAGELGEFRSRAAVRSAEQDRDVSEMREIAAALVRMEEERYGDCMDCGRDIPFARLEVQPTARRCIPCQQRFEKAHPVEIRGTPMHER